MSLCRIRARIAATLSLLCFAGPAVAGSAPSPFANWAVVVAAGDYTAQSGAPAEIFDNARRDVAQGLADVGFSKENILQFSVRPERYLDTKPLRTDFTAILDRLKNKAAAAKAGCLFYYTSHGAQDKGAVLALEGGAYGVVAPSLVNEILDEACPGRPSIVVISACFSGFYVQPLAKSDRMILTAARADRTSFGCGEMDKYPYFDDCFIAGLKTAPDFVALGRSAQACVGAKEKVLRESGAGGQILPSEPQLRIGGALGPMLPLYRFSRTASAP